MAFRPAPPAAAFSRILRSIPRLLSLSSEKLCHAGRSAGISELLTQFPQANWEKPTQGSTLLSILSILNPAPGLAEAADWEKLAAVTTSKTAGTRWMNRIKEIPLGQRMRSNG